MLCYRAGEEIREVLEPLERILDESAIDYELVLVANFDTGRPDTTPDVVRAWASTRPRARVLAEPKNGRAMGWDFRQGLAAGSGEYLVLIDGDTQNPVEDVLRAYHEMRLRNLDLIKGRRVTRGDGPYRRLVSLVYNLLFLVMFQTRSLWDINGKPKGLRRESYQRMRLLSEDWFVDAELVLAARRNGMRIGELPVNFRANEKRASFVKFEAVFEFLWNMLRYRMRAR